MGCGDPKGGSFFLYTYSGHFFHLLGYVALIIFAWHQPSSLLCYPLTVLASLGGSMELRYMWWRRTLPPGSAGFPLLGHLPMILPSPLKYGLAETRRFKGQLRTMNVLGRPAVVFTSEEDAQWYLRREREGKIVSSMLPHFTDLIGSEAIMLQSGRNHQRLRKLFGPAFGPDAVLGYVPVMDSLTQSMLQQWCEREEFVEPREWALLAFRIFLQSALGQVDEEMMKRMIDLFQKWTSSMTIILPIAYPGSNLSKGISYRKELGEAIDQLIDNFTAAHPPESNEAKRSVMGLMVYSKDEDGNSPTRKQLIDNIRFIMFAGFDTMKASLSAATYYLHRDPKAYSLLVQEVQGFSEPLNPVELKEAPVLNAILAEMWRLNPPLHTHPGEVTTDLKYKGYFLPKGTLASMSYQAYHHSEKAAFPDHTKFLIERWLPPGHPLYDPKLRTTIDYNLMSVQYRTFGAGQHMCLGAHFAKLEARVVLTRLAQRYDFTVRNETLQTFPLWQRMGEFRLFEREATPKHGKEE